MSDQQHEAAITRVHVERLHEADKTVSARVTLGAHMPRRAARYLADTLDEVLRHRTQRDPEGTIRAEVNWEDGGPVTITLTMAEGHFDREPRGIRSIVEGEVRAALRRDRADAEWESRQLGWAQDLCMVVRP